MILSIDGTENFFLNEKKKSIYVFENIYFFIYVHSYVTLFQYLIYLPYCWPGISTNDAAEQILSEYIYVCLCERL